MPPQSNHIINANENNFQYEVIAYSQNTPVVVDFWAPWCRDCRTMSPLLERLVQQAQGSFRLAKVNVDENPNLTLLYNVRSVPTIKAISFGNVIFEYAGIIPEPKIREMLQKLSELNTENLTLERANNLLLDHQWQLAGTAYREYHARDPNQPIALQGLAKAELAQNHIEEARTILTNFPISRFTPQADLLFALANTLGQFINHQLPTMNELDNTFQAAIRLAYLGNIAASLDGLLDIIREDKTYRDGKAKTIFLAILEMMGSENADMRAYRQELANTLF